MHFHGGSHSSKNNSIMCAASWVFGRGSAYEAGLQGIAVLSQACWPARSSLLSHIVRLGVALDRRFRCYNGPAQCGAPDGAVCWTIRWLVLQVWKGVGRRWTVIVVVRLSRCGPRGARRRRSPDRATNGLGPVIPREPFGRVFRGGMCVLRWPSSSQRGGARAHLQRR